jgi:hypothetical protein
MMEFQGKLAEDLREALERVRTLEGMLPIFAWCKKVCNDRGIWEQVEAYVSEHSHATWIHGIYPECQQKVLQEGPLETKEPQDSLGSSA